MAITPEVEGGTGTVPLRQHDSHIINKPGLKTMLVYRFHGP